MALATAGMVPGEYHRCGFGVESGRPQQVLHVDRPCAPSWASAYSILFMNES